MTKKLLKLLIICILCFTIVYGMVWLVQNIFTH